jgi:hypothetical protein
MFLENCLTNQQRSLLESNCLFWIKTLIQIFENYPIGLHAKLAHYCYYLLIQSSKKLSAELNRVISTTLIEKSVNLLVSSNDAVCQILFNFCRVLPIFPRVLVDLSWPRTPWSAWMNWFHVTKHLVPNLEFSFYYLRCEFGNIRHIILII